MEWWVLLLLGMGLQEFSALPPVLPKIKKLIRSVTFSEAQKFADDILKLTGRTEIEQRVARRTKEILES